MKWTNRKVKTPAAVMKKVVEKGFFKQIREVTGLLAFYNKKSTKLSDPGML